MSQSQEKANSDPQRAIRLRDNKRRHRQRKKEYVADLERRLEEARNHGIQATKEVQIAAQKVAWENSRLRQILHEQGLDCSAINSLIYKDGPFQPDVTLLPKASTQSSTVSCATHEVSSAEPERVGSSLDALPIASPASSSPKSSYLPEAHPERMLSDAIPAPCKILTLLAGNPNADITQVPAVVSEESEDKESGGVECSQAREMLIRFATTESKLSVVACALEEGCVKNKSGRGCHVKSDVLLDTLDRICD